jgi:hypothetical protein
VQETVLPTLAAWGSFYVIVGSSGAALTGLQFVVMALVAESRMPRSTREIDTFGTPTIVHFCAVLLVSAILSAPWGTLSSVGLAISGLGFAGLAYAMVLIRRVRKVVVYKPVLEDWIWHFALPILAYAAFLVSGLLLAQHRAWVPFVIGATSLLLLFIGIHNAWDTVTYVATEQFDARNDPPRPASGGAGG